MNILSLFSGVVAVIALVIGVVALQPDNSGVGAAPGVSIFPDSVTTFTQGGGYSTLSTSSASYTLAASDIDVENYVSFQPLGAAATLTLPATTSFPGIPNPGDHRIIIIQNAATAATTTTIAAGAGVDLQEPDGQNVIIGQNSYAILHVWRQSNGNIVANVDEIIPAD